MFFDFFLWVFFEKVRCEYIYAYGFIFFKLLQIIKMAGSDENFVGGVRPSNPQGRIHFY